MAPIIVSIAPAKVVLIIAFAVTQITVIQPTKKLANVSGPDLIIKNTAIKNGKKMQQKLIDDEKIINSEFSIIQENKNNEVNPRSHG